MRKVYEISSHEQLEEAISFYACRVINDYSHLKNQTMEFSSKSLDDLAKKLVDEKLMPNSDGFDMITTIPARKIERDVIFSPIGKDELKRFYTAFNEYAKAASEKTSAGFPWGLIRSELFVNSRESFLKRFYLRS